MTVAELEAACFLPPAGVLAAASRLWDGVYDRPWLHVGCYCQQGDTVKLRRAGGDWYVAEEAFGCWFARDLASGAWLWRRP